MNYYIFVCFSCQCNLTIYRSNVNHGTWPLYVILRSVSGLKSHYSYTFDSKKADNCDNIMPACNKVCDSLGELMLLSSFNLQLSFEQIALWQ